MDFWGHIKSLIYETPVESEVDLVARIAVAMTLCHSVLQRFKMGRLQMIHESLNMSDNPFGRGTRPALTYWGGHFDRTLL